MSLSVAAPSLTVDRVLTVLTFGFSVVSLAISARLAWRMRRTYWLPKSIILIRHGESEGNTAEDYYQTTPDPLVPLSETGRQQSEKVGRLLKEKIGNAPVWIYCSPYTRARETAMIALAQLSPEQVVYIREDPRLREQEFCANFQTDGMAPKEERDRYSKFFYRWLQGESAADVFDRVSVFMASIWRDFSSHHFGEHIGDDGYVLMFTHGLTMRVFLMSWLHWRHEEFDQSVNPENCGMLELKRESFGRHAFRLTPESRSILFRSDNHHIRRSSLALRPPELTRFYSWVAPNKEERWFHHLLEHEREMEQSLSNESNCQLNTSSPQPQNETGGESMIVSEEETTSTVSMSRTTTEMMMKQAIKPTPNGNKTNNQSIVTFATEENNAAAESHDEDVSDVEDFVDDHDEAVQVSMTRAGN